MTDRPRRFDLIVFDWDGTLYDSTGLIARCLQSACADVGAPVPSLHDASHVIGLGLAEALAHVAPTLPRERHAALAQRYRHHYLARHDELVLFDGTVAMLDALKGRGHLLAVATGKTRRGLDDVLAKAELAGRFDASRTADETASKPDPRMLDELFAELGVARERALMIGDTTHDLMMAERAGCASVAVGFGAHPASNFAAHAPLAVAHSTDELQRWLLAHA